METQAVLWVLWLKVDFKLCGVVVQKKKKKKMKRRGGAQSLCNVENTL